MLGRAQRMMLIGLIAVLVGTLLPARPVIAQVQVAPEAVLPLQESLPDLPDPPALPPEELTVPPLVDPSLPSLTVQLAVEPTGWVAVGDVLTATITVANQAPHPAEDLTLTLPLPAEATPVDPRDPALGADGWAWPLGTLAAQSAISVTVVMQLRAMPQGAALTLEPSAIARGLTLPIMAVGGALVTTDPLRAADPAETPAPASSASMAVVEGASADLGGLTTTDLSTDLPSTVRERAPPARARARFTPGQPAELRSPDGLLTVRVPGDLFDQPLTLEYLTPAEIAPRLQARQQVLPPAVAGFHRGFGAFFLEATDDQGRDVGTFRAPLTIQVRFTPQQLRVLGIAPENLTLFWFDESREPQRGGPPRRGQWVPQRTVVDLATGTATIQVDHFSGYQLSDGSSPSAAFIPSLQGWQVSGFTGAASFSYPLDLPAGPAGIKPALALSYSSAATDGGTTMRTKQQASWVGKGWTLDTGSVSLNKIEVSSTNIVNQYAMSVGGRSYNLVRAEALVAGADPGNPTHWAWRPTDESFIRARITTNGPSTPGSAGNPGRGASDYGTPYTRHMWTLWDQSGTRYEFSEDVWWGWADCNGSGQFAYFESNRWLLSRIVDPHGNVIQYTYDRSREYFGTCNSQAGTVDYDIWPLRIEWGANPTAGHATHRYKVEFVSIARTNDTQYDFPDFTIGGPTRETRQLNAVQVFSNPSGSWQLVREYRFTYDYSLLSDARRCVNTNCPLQGGWTAETGFPKLTLKSIQRIANNGSSALPALTFSYQTSGGSNFDATGGWNRLTGMDNGQGGTLTLAYANIAVAISGDDLFRNRHRVTTRTTTDGQGNSATWSYAYTLPQANAIGTNLGDGIATSPHPNAATLYYNVFLDGDADYSDERWLVHRTWTSFLGHATVTETDPSGTTTTRSFHQGDAGCTPAVSARGSHAAITGNSCFQDMLKSEQLKGREFKTEIRSAGGALLSETLRQFDVDLLDYSHQPLTGLWRAFSYEYQVDEIAWEGGSTASTKRTETFYNGSCTLNAVDAFGNPRCIREYERGSLLRTTIHAYGVRDTATEYLLDRRVATSVLDSANRYLAHRQFFYDGNNQSLGTIGSRGRLTRSIEVFDLPTPPQASLTNLTLNGRDATTVYDLFGNPTEQRSYAGPGWVLWNGSAWSASTPGNGSAASLTTIAYDATFRAFSVSTTNPLNQTQSAGYDYRMGTLTSVTDANSVTTTATYDLFGRMATLIKPGDSPSHPTVQVWYYDSEQPFRYRIDQRETAGGGNTRIRQLFYDGLGRQIQTKVEATEGSTLRNIITDTRYDGLGRVVQQSQPRLVTAADTTIFEDYQAPPGSGVAWTTTAYDGLGRPSQVTAPDGSVTAHRYGVDSATALRWHDVTDPNRHRTQRQTDALGRLVRVLELRGNCGNYWGYTCTTAPFTTAWITDATTTYSYNAQDQLSQVSDAKGNLTTLSYDSLGRKLAMSDPNMGSWSYAYDADGNLTRQTDAKGQRICFYYDALDRLTGKHHRSDNSCPSSPTNGQLAMRYVYDQGTHGVGRRTFMEVTGGASTSWGYDGRGRVVTTTHSLPTLGAATRVFLRQYNSADDLTRITFPSVNGSAEAVTYAYDSSGRPTSVCISGGGCYAQSLQYNALSQPTFRRHGNNAVQRWSYDSLLSRLDRLQVGTDSVAGSFFDRSYDYDAVGNIALIADNTSPGIPDQSYSYDHRDRLLSWTLGSTTQSYAYDELGNLTTKAGVTQQYGANFDGTGAGPHQVRRLTGAGGPTYSYDANGNLTSGGGRSLTWTHENMPASITAGGVTESYSYDADSARVTRTRSGATTVYLEGMWEEVVGGTILKYYTLGGEVVALRNHAGMSSAISTVSYLHGDHLGSVGLTTGATGSPATPTLQSQQEFDPWGLVRSGGVGQTRRNFTGQYLDETGLLFYNARYYDPVLGRFVSADVLVPGADGMEGLAYKPLTVGFANATFLAALNDENRQPFWYELSEDERQEVGRPWGPENPQSLNRYAYVLNNPLKYTDPTGHWGWLVRLIANFLANLAKSARATPHAVPQAANRASHELYKNQLRQAMQRPLVKDPRLQDLMDDLYRPNATVGSGSTADAIRYELATGGLVGGRSHLQKGLDYIRALERWLRNNPNASPGDRAAAENVLRDLADAYKTKLGDPIP